MPDRVKCIDAYDMKEPIQHNLVDKRVICIRWGQKYGTDYVNRLYGMVARNISLLLHH